MRRLLGPVAATDGRLMFDLSTAILVAVIHNVIRTRLDSSSQIFLD